LKDTAVERNATGAALVLRLRTGKDDPLLGRELKRVLVASTDALEDAGRHLDASVLSVDRAGGFIGNTFGPYAVRR